MSTLQLVPENPTLLYSPDAEMTALGCCLFGERAVHTVLSTVQPSDFFLAPHRLIASAIASMAAAGTAIDPVTLRHALIARQQFDEIGGDSYLIRIQEFVPSPAHARHYAEIVRDYAVLRNLRDAGAGILELVNDPDLATHEKLIQAESLVAGAAAPARGQGTLTHVREFALQMVTEYDSAAENQAPPSAALSTGFWSLDERLGGGLEPGELIVVAARPSMGKTSLGAQIALNAATARNAEVNPVAFFSIEMTPRQIARRLACAVASVDSRAAKEARLTPEQLRRYTDAQEALYNSGLYIDDSSGLTLMELVSRARDLKRTKGLKLIVVDYLQLITTARKGHVNRTQEVDEIVAGLKRIAKELDVPVVALAQLSRAVESRDNKRPNLGDLRESGGIEAAADVVLMIYRDAYYQAKERPHEQDYLDTDRTEEAEIIFAKFRNGPTGTEVLGFQPTYARFNNLAR